MQKLTGQPQNAERFVRLIAFFKTVLDLCTTLAITPILDGSLAVFVYTNNRAMIVNDVDLSCSETEFPRLMAALDKRGINYRLREWHVLQLLQGDLKVEFSSAEHWLPNLPLVCETLELDTHTVQMMSLPTLREFYRQAMDDRTGKADPNEQIKLADLRTKYIMLTKVGNR